MKIKILFPIFLIFLTINLCQADDTIENLIEERIQLRQEYRAEYIERAESEAKGSGLKETEDLHGKAWVELLKLAQSTDDPTLKKKILELDLLNDLAVAKWDLLYSQSEVDRNYYKGRIQMYERQLKLVEEIDSNQAREDNSE